MKADVGIALRSTVFPPSLIPSLVPELDSSFSAVWFPSVGGRFDSVEMCALSLGASTRLKAGTGVIRLAEYNLEQLAGRIETLDQGSRNRFILGVGTGHLRGREALSQLVGLTRKLRAGYPNARPTPLYFAALGPRMVEAAFENADGVLLNFCSPSYASSVVSRAGRKKEGFQIACYVKLFFAHDDDEASRMLADEFANYNSIPQYHAMFGAMGLSQTLARLSNRGEVSKRDVGEVSQISIANPDRESLLELLGRFREGGVDSPVLYPYVAGEEDYKLEIARRLGDWMK